MKLYYIAPKEVYFAGYRHMSESHAIDLPDGKSVLIAAQFADDNSEAAWSSHNNVLPLPHPLSGETITSEHVSYLGERLGVNETHNVFQVAKAAAKFHPLMKLHVI
jgi:hypothetical protein